MTIKPAPRGGFYIATQGRLTAFGRTREEAMGKLLRAIWPMPQMFVEESVSKARVVNNGPQPAA